MDRLRCLFGDPAAVPHPLGVVRYGTVATAPSVRSGTPTVDLHLVRDPAQAVTEVWTTDRPVSVGSRDGIAFGHDGRYVFCAGRVPAAARYAPGVRQAYRRAFGLLVDLGYPYVVRMWNFVGRINEPNADGLEIYRDFCRGRAEAFDSSPLPRDTLPAATGVGAHTEGVTFYLLARRAAGHVAVENHRQVPAYHYPDRYGPRPPSFARASRLPDGELLISGTASILGHATVHPGDVVAQCRTTLANLATLAADLSALQAVKVYVRHTGDLDAVRRLCTEVFVGDVAYLVTDLCRTDLLVEMEGMSPRVRRQVSVPV
ncbi:FkbO/Hyg5 family chorismatase [Plantactinospora solaniradicis]|uniref:FkbO/Hyg5 family chorismatase n=1 Tax=Plantactinospora solaniradicis TaxID=1723736 RepID=A0ABW1K5R1_9ACTN